jgi:small nuclear ribonucleoprotein (snRNP)-like protein
MNLALEHAFDITEKDERKEIGSMVLRGSSIVWIEALDRL